MQEFIAYELSQFLKSKRSSLNPKDFGFAVGRRHGKGLRREEVAQLAGVSVTWYTWLEQGKDIRVSDFLVTNLSRSLNLSEIENEYLHDLIRHLQGRKNIRYEASVSLALKNLVDAIGYPSFLRNGRWDLVYWNDLAAEYIGEKFKSDARTANILRLAFLDETHKSIISNWEETVEFMVAQFRRDFGRFARCIEFKNLVSELSESSSEFKKYWQQQMVLERESGTRSFKNPSQKIIKYERICLTVESNDFLKMEVYVPVAK